MSCDGAIASCHWDKQWFTKDLLKGELCTPDRRPSSWTTNSSDHHLAVTGILCVGRERSPMRKVYWCDDLWGVFKHSRSYLVRATASFRSAERVRLVQKALAVWSEVGQNTAVGSLQCGLLVCVKDDTLQGELLLDRVGKDLGFALRWRGGTVTTFGA